MLSRFRLIQTASRRSSIHAIQPFEQALLLFESHIACSRDWDFDLSVFHEWFCDSSQILRIFSDRSLEHTFVSIYILLKLRCLRASHSLTAPLFLNFLNSLLKTCSIAGTGHLLFCLSLGLRKLKLSSSTFVVAVIGCMRVHRRQHVSVDVFGFDWERHRFLAYTASKLCALPSCISLRGQFSFFDFLGRVDSVIVRVELKLCLQRPLQKLGVYVGQKLMGCFLAGEVMSIDYVFDLVPFFQSLFPQQSLAVLTQIFQLCLIRTADIAVVLKVDVQDKIFRDDFVFVFTDVFRTELHFTCLDIIASLNEGSVKHDAEHGLVREASMFKYNLHVALHNHTLFLLLCQQENDSILSLAVSLLRWVSKLFPDVKSSATVHFKEWCASSS